jgi:hypothetical protein
VQVRWPENLIEMFHQVYRLTIPRIDCSTGKQAEVHSNCHGEKTSGHSFESLCKGT